FRLLEDFLEHVVLKAAELDVAFFDLQIMDEMIDPTMIAMRHLQGVGGDQRDLVISEIDDLVGPAGQGRRVAGQKMLAVTDANTQGTALSRRYNDVGPIAKQDHEAVCAAEFGQRVLYCS